MVKAKDTRLPTNKQIKLVASGEFWKEDGAHSVNSHDSFMNFTEYKMSPFPICTFGSLPNRMGKRKTSGI
jgi:hypothetical protein